MVKIEFVESDIKKKYKNGKQNDLVNLKLINCKIWWIISIGTHTLFLVLRSYHNAMYQPEHKTARISTQSDSQQLLTRIISHADANCPAVLNLANLFFFVFLFITFVVCSHVGTQLLGRHNVQSRCRDLSSHRLIVTWHWLR